MAIINGTNSSETLRGTSGNDIIRGFGGNDRLEGLSGADDLYGNQGNDVLFLQSGGRRGFGGQGDDRIFGDSTNDDIRGDLGRDTLTGGAGRDTLIGGNLAGDGSDDISGGSDRDLIFGNDGNDQLRGNSGEDQIFGGQGSDFIEGGDGDDRLFGDVGLDILIGGRGDDVISGGSGDDVFFYTLGNRDDHIITDFQGSFQTQDTLIISSPNSNNTTAISRAVGSDLVIAISDGSNQGFVTLKGRADLSGQLPQSRQSSTRANRASRTTQAPNFSEENKPMTHLDLFNSSYSYSVMQSDLTLKTYHNLDELLGSLDTDHNWDEILAHREELLPEDFIPEPSDFPEGYVSPGVTIYEGDIEDRERLSQAIALLEKGESVEHLGFHESLTVEDLKEALYETNVNNLLSSPENPLFDYSEAIANDPLLSYDPSLNSYTTSDDLFDAFNKQIEDLPLYTEPVYPSDVDFISGKSFFGMIFANIDANEVSLI